MTKDGSHVFEALIVHMNMGMVGFGIWQTCYIKQNCTGTRWQTPGVL